MMITVTLTGTETDLAENIAYNRHEANRDADVENQRIGPQSDYETDLNGIVGELAVAKVLNVYPDLKVEPSSGGVDLNYNGHSIDVKATTYEDGKLIAPIWKPKKPHADLFVLTTVENYPEVRVIGFTSAESFFDDDNVMNLGHGPCFGVEQTSLTPIRELQNL